MQFLKLGAERVNSWSVWERKKSPYLLVKSMFLLQDKRLIQTPGKGGNRGVKHENQDKCDGLQNLVKRIKIEFIKNNPPSMMEFKVASEWMIHTACFFFLIQNLIAWLLTSIFCITEQQRAKHSCKTSILSLIVCWT